MTFPRFSTSGETTSLIEAVRRRQITTAGTMNTLLDWFASLKADLPPPFPPDAVKAAAVAVCNELAELREIREEGDE